MDSSTEIFEITDTSINIGTNEEKIGAQSAKRRLEDHDDSEKDESIVKKFKDETTVSIESSKEESKLDDTEKDLSNYEEVDETNLLTESASSMLDEIEPSVEIGVDDSKEEDDDAEQDYESEEEEDENISDSEESGSESDDAMMMRAINASSSTPKQISNDEAIALDDSDSEIEDENDTTLKSQMNQSKDEESQEYEDMGEYSESDDDVSEYSLRRRMLRQNPRFYIARLLLKKSIRILNQKRVKNMEKIVEKEIEREEKIENEGSMSIKEVTVDDGDDKEKASVDEEEEEKTEKVIEEVETKSGESEKVTKVSEVNDDEKMQIDEEIDKEEEEILPSTSKEPQPSARVSLKPNDIDTVDTNHHETKKPLPSDKNSLSNSSNNNQDEGIEEQSNSLLTEISNSTIDEIMSRYVLRNNTSDQANSAEDFNEELFICLQQNKQDILKAQKVWNEKLHVKFKIREIMERIRRHRAAADIENFGYKPPQENSCNPMISSKSSTNSENDHFEKSSRMSSESVSRLIQDVRANVLKREDKQRTMEQLGDSALFDDSNDFNLRSHLQSLQSAQGRQGQIIDVQSIINDFRQKNPQEVPRRGRRMKSSFGGGNSILPEQHLQTSYSRLEHNSLNSSAKSNNTSGFPEVSLLPVNNFYKNLSQTSAGSGGGGGTQFGQKSLLQSILTKSTRSSFSPINNSAGTSTLARLLTAPERERNIQNQARQSMGEGRQSNGEITITPIAGASRKHEFSMDYEDNSNEPPLVIDEPEEFESKPNVLLCQGCKRNKALFMCAGCSKQWYCSKGCQEMAWDDHAEACMV